MQLVQTTVYICSSCARSGKYPLFRTGHMYLHPGTVSQCKKCILEEHTKNLEECCLCVREGEMLLEEKASIVPKPNSMQAALV